MRRLLLPLLLVAALAVALPPAAAQDEGGFPNETEPGYRDGQPAPGTGNANEPVGPQLAVEGPPGILYYVALLALSLAVGGVLFYVVFKQDRNPPPNMK